jgi:hypothetical protein
MTIIDIEMYKNIIEDVLLNRGSKVNIFIENLRAYL